MLNKRTAVEISVAAASNCLRIFEEAYPTDTRPRRALEAAERWLGDPATADLPEIYKLETAVWRSKDWRGRAATAAQVCAFAARAIRCPQSSVKAAIVNESFANGIEFNKDYSRRFLWSLIPQSRID